MVFTIYSLACGRAPLNTRIVGGQEASPGFWPWQVYILTRDSMGTTFICGGSLINREWVMTAAHCHEGITVGLGYLTQVFLGSVDRTSSRNSVMRMVVEVVFHPDYNSSIAFINDIVLLKLDSPVTYTSRIQPVCLSKNDSTIQSGQTSWVAGFGETSESKGTIHVHVTSQITTISNLKLSHRKGQILGHRSHPSLCSQGDSGGPLVVKQDGVWIQIGIVSATDGCALPNKPAIYTEVLHFQDWIEKLTVTSCIFCFFSPHKLPLN
uniref:Peptidase S1 domain-containing protein n=1 Tax=Periophthalmus magnuspinnatus TaxID=409849 RepID=A0A3B4B800_9GOBI